MISNQITAEYLSNYLYREMVPLQCQRCDVQFVKLKSEIQNHLRRGRKIYCSRSCNSHARNEKHNHGASVVVCDWCSKEFKKRFAELSKTQHSFCGHSCAAKWRNAHKTVGSRRSKLEFFLEEKIRSKYPDLLFNVNNRSVVGYELDFYFPDLMLACEVNGICHYKPVYGLSKYKRTQEIDLEKTQRCLDKKIELLVIPNLFTTFSDTTCSQCWAILDSTIEKKILVRGLDSNK